jgi:hypothetical protein
MPKNQSTAAKRARAATRAGAKYTVALRDQASCSACNASMFTSSPQPHYDHVHSVESLPRARHTDIHEIVSGYAVGMGGPLPQTWVFFKDIEPAIVFGRAARMSDEVSTYGVYEAAREVRYTEHLRRDTRTLLVNFDADIRDHETERPHLERWVQGCSPRYASFAPPRSR